MTWLANAHVLDLTGRANGAGNGPFRAGQFYGVVLHCNGSIGADTPDSYFAAGGGPDSVCPNFQVHADGSIAQYLPLEWSPWCQADGNTNYAAIETAGGPDPLNSAQVASVASIVRAYHDILGMPLQLAEAPGQRGLGYHAMGGAAWGGHPCPLPARIAQRSQILQLAGGESAESGGAIQIGDTDMPLTSAEVDAVSVRVLQRMAGLYTRVDNLTAAVAKLQATASAIPEASAVRTTQYNAGVFTRLDALKPQVQGVQDTLLAAVAAHTQTITSSGPVDLDPVLTAIKALPADVRAELAKHLGA